MPLPEAFRHQRAEGEVLLRTGPEGLIRMREAGSAKVRLPQGTSAAILINTSGGLAGGDRLGLDLGVEAHAQLTLTTQAAERVYRTLGPAAEVAVTLAAGAGASLHWLPQETILFDGAALSRRFQVDLAADARFLGVESIILGRKASGEVVASARLSDRWRIRRAGRLVHADDIAFDGPPPASLATLGEARAFATIVATGGDAGDHLDRVRAALGRAGAASTWSGKLVARLAAADGFELRKALIPAFSVLAGAYPLPKVWSL